MPFSVHRHLLFLSQTSWLPVNAKQTLYVSDRTVYCVVKQDEYRFLYAAMKEFLNRPEANVLGRDCRLFPPTLAKFQPKPLPSSSQIGTQQFPSVYPSSAMTSSGNRGNMQVRGPWLTPAAPDRAAYRATGDHQSTIPGQSRAHWQGLAEPGDYVRPDRTQQQNSSGLNVSMNRATSEHQPPAQYVPSSSSLVNDEQQLRSASATHSQTSDNSAAEQHVGWLPQTTVDRDDQPTTSFVTSTPLDH